MVGFGVSKRFEALHAVPIACAFLEEIKDRAAIRLHDHAVSRSRNNSPGRDAAHPAWG